MSSVLDDLPSRFKSGDEAAVKEAVERYSGAIAVIARSTVGSPELVAEVVQQTFIKAWKASSTFDETRELKPWLYQIARRTAVDVLRREGRAPVATGESVDTAVTPLSFERTWQQYEVRQALDELPVEERQVMKLSFLAGLTHEQIAEQLGIPVGTVKSRTGRAKKRLLRSLGHLDPTANQTGRSDVEGGEGS